MLDCEACDSGQTVDRNCFPVPIPPNDPFFPLANEDGRPKCLHFARSLVGQLTLGEPFSSALSERGGGDGVAGYREQQNQITAFIDASNVYGSDDCRAAELRTFEGGQLAFQPDGLLPANPDDHECRSASPHHCFRAGKSLTLLDARVVSQIRALFESRRRDSMGQEGHMQAQFGVTANSSSKKGTARKEGAVR